MLLPLMLSMQSAGQEAVTRPRYKDDHLELKISAPTLTVRSLSDVNLSLTVKNVGKEDFLLVDRIDIQMNVLISEAGKPERSCSLTSSQTAMTRPPVPLAPGDEDTYSHFLRNYSCGGVSSSDFSLRIVLIAGGMTMRTVCELGKSCPPARQSRPAEYFYSNLLHFYVASRK